MSFLSKENQKFISIGIGLFFIFFLLNLLSFRNPDLSLSESLLNGLGLSLLYSAAGMLLFYVLYTFIKMISDLFRKETGN